MRGPVGTITATWATTADSTAAWQFGRVGVLVCCDWTVTVVLVVSPRGWCRGRGGNRTTEPPDVNHRNHRQHHSTLRG